MIKMYFTACQGRQYGYREDIILPENNGEHKGKREPASFLLGISGEKVAVANVRPILFGNKENDFACICDGIFYLLAEAQSTLSPNIAYRLLEYITAGLRATVDSEQLLYGRKRVYFPVPKLYVLQVGLEKAAGSLPEEVRYDICLSGLRHMTVTSGAMRWWPTE